MTRRRILLAAAIAAAGAAGFAYGWRRDARRTDALAAELWAARQ